MDQARMASEIYDSNGLWFPFIKAATCGHPAAAFHQAQSEAVLLGTLFLLGLKLFARFESDGFAGRNFGHLACARVSPDAAFARLDDEDSEAAQLYALASLQSVLHGVKERFDRDLSLDFRDARFIGYLIHYIEFYHTSLRFHLLCS